MTKFCFFLNFTAAIPQKYIPKYISIESWIYNISIRYFENLNISLVFKLLPKLFDASHDQNATALSSSSWTTRWRLASFQISKHWLFWMMRKQMMFHPSPNFHPLKKTISMSIFWLRRWFYSQWRLRYWSGNYWWHWWSQQPRPVPSSSIQVSSTCKADMTFLPLSLLPCCPKLALILTQFLCSFIFPFSSHRNRSDNVKINVLCDLVFLKHSDTSFTKIYFRFKISWLLHMWKLSS